jgi:hypothetical protein
MLKSLIIQSLTGRYVKFDLYFIITFYTKDIFCEEVGTYQYLKETEY